MSEPAGDDAAARRVLEAILDRPAGPAKDDVVALAALASDVLDRALRGFAEAHETAALPVLTALVARGDRPVRRAARRALYRLSLRGVEPPRAAPRPLVSRTEERATRAWVSGIDGAGSRGLWIVFDGGPRGLVLCTLILNDVRGVVQAGGGPVSKKRLDRELQALASTPALTWVEAEPDSGRALVADALRLHAERGAPPPPEIEPWRHLFDDAPALPPLPAPDEADGALVDRSPELLEIGEMSGWYCDPEAAQSDALDLLQARESRLVVSDQIKAEREDAIVSHVVEREFAPDGRARWARRLAEMARVLATSGRDEPARLARAAAAALADPGRDPRHHALARALARRALDVAAEVTLGRVKPSEVARPPGDARDRISLA